MNKNSDKLTACYSQSGETGCCRLTVFFLLAFYFSLFTGSCFAAEFSSNIVSDMLEYDGTTFTYSLTGSAEFRKGNTFIKAEKIRFNKKTAEVHAEGNVEYDDPEISIKAGEVELNYDTQRGRLLNAEVFFKKDNSYIRGKEIEKKGEKEYFLKEALFTTCDSPLPAWCFKGKNADISVGDRLKARNVSFYIKGLPVLYTPYLWAPLLTERKAGFLLPVAGHTRSRGFHLRVPFFWPITDNTDATFLFDIYTRNGIGKGVEYRYKLTEGGAKGRLWGYHIKNSQPGARKDLFEFQGLHEQKIGENTSVFLNLNTINWRYFYREHHSLLELKTDRYLESASNITYSGGNHDAYIRFQYLIDLYQENRTVVQRLPEAGYFLKAQKAGPFLFRFTSQAANFWRESGFIGQRVDLYPRFDYSFGKSVTITQSLGLRETAYLVNRNSGTEVPNDTVHRELFDYGIVATTTFSKRYSLCTHILKPSISYIFIPGAKGNVPQFDSIDFIGRTSRVTLAADNYLKDKKGDDFIYVRVSQPYEFNYGDRPFIPLSVEGVLFKPFVYRFDTAYDVHTGKVNTFNSKAEIKMKSAAIAVGERFNRTDAIKLLTLEFNVQATQALAFENRIWYDPAGRGLRDLLLSARYAMQCWGLTLSYARKPEDTVLIKPPESVFFMMFELKGLGSYKTGFSRKT